MRLKLTELQIQSSFVQWCKWNPNKLPYIELGFAVPNAGHRSKGERFRRIAEGIKKGVPDWCLPVPKNEHHGLFLEFKSAKGRLAKEQRFYLKELHNLGYKVAVVRTLEEAVKIVLEYYSIKQ